ncbi:MAG: acyltransferase family protein [Pseudomonadota bacterium]
MGERKYFLDWLRVAAFGFLILFHVGMLYVTWGYNLKSPRLVPEAEPFMSVIGAFRLALLFFISGVASRFLIAKLGPGDFARDRVRRLLPVILFGMLVIVPPQIYVELISKNVTHMRYLTFWWTQYLAANQTLVAPLHRTMPSWDHLWFIVYLFFYTLLFAVFVLVTRPWHRTARHLPIAALLTAPAILLPVANLIILYRFPITDALLNDWGGHLKFAGMFVAGAVCARQDGFWDLLRRYRFVFGAVALVLVAVQSRVNDPLWSVVSGAYAWTSICALCGFAAQHLSGPSALLTRLNEAVLPVYVLHQPILLIAADYVFPRGLPLAVEAAVLVAITVAGCVLIYETAIRPFGVSRFLFGLKPKT